MSSLIPAAVCFLAAVLSHAAAFRGGRATLHPRSVGLIAAAWLIVLIGLLVKRPGAFPLSSIIVYGFLCLVYADELVILEDHSPSLEVLRLISRHGPGALSEAELKAQFTDEVWIVQRLKTLIRDGLVERSGESYRLRPRAWRTIRWLDGYRAFLRRSPGG